MELRLAHSAWHATVGRVRRRRKGRERGVGDHDAMHGHRTCTLHGVDPYTDPVDLQGIDHAPLLGGQAAHAATVEAALREGSASLAPRYHLIAPSAFAGKNASG